MTGETENIVLEYLRHIHGTVDRLADDMREVKERLGILERQYASISTRLDRMDERVTRIESHLGLVSAI